ncbi:pentapeptide repeat-containing protein [Pseudoalteromonas umbrosa]|uniref:pentapeptide repeat-containing protein n=1 Tax=Pseudoalteromonas umbrosa TaxID=3048489 RepID=UPI0024C2D67C|nr:pentapeptide repeat-containing protein [Pseudoalteromonas sp. B95]MDK1287961.1 pentapeptide repeat-containing protein [Pseudoalteromonas sp. B95]
MSIHEHSEFWSIAFESEDFSTEEFISKEFESCIFKGCNFSETSFRSCKFIDCEFIKCNLSLTKMHYSQFSDVVFRDSKAIGIDWTKAGWPRLMLSSPIKFYDCMLNDSSFFGLQLHGFILENCVVRGVDFRDGDFTRASFKDSEFCGSMFSSTNLSSVDFSNATGFDIDIFSNTINKAKFDRFEATRLLSCLEVELV